ncbi:hypothetical protein GGX14DRAFT_406984 [Mycena pura]|uniref:Uncharacterized protein n=1 Tax=Mycena pura TaxID=153505 RepID=A0AAD6UP55_9AGAR|nr:hypothetical protein GGX14DRAFT_406984 [Mycena pura]
MAPKLPKITATPSDAWPPFNHVDFANLAFYLRNTGSLGKYLPHDVKKAIHSGFPSIRFFCKAFDRRIWPPDVACFLDGFKNLLTYLSDSRKTYPSEWDRIPYPELLGFDIFPVTSAFVIPTMQPPPDDELQGAPQLLQPVGIIASGTGCSQGLS